jgi:hypothetical protein
MAKERKVPKQLHELTGDPDVDYEEATDAPDPRWVAEMERQVEAHVEGLSEQAHQEGIDLPDWNQPSEEH